MQILALTNLFPTPWDPLRAPFNRQQFERLARRHRLRVLASIDFRERMSGAAAPQDVGVDARYFTYFYPPRLGRSLHALFWFASLMLRHGVSLLSQRDVDCVLASWAFPDAVAASWLARILGVPYVVKVHGSDINVQAGHALRRHQIAYTLRRAAAVVAVSRALAQRVAALGVAPERIHVIYNGVDAGRFGAGSRSSSRTALGLDQDETAVLYVGNLKHSKGCTDLIDAFVLTAQRLPHARLYLVGKGPDRAALELRAAASAVADRIRFVGALEPARLGDWYRAADFLCLPSHNEGVPNVVLESMALGLPVLASRVGGIPEVLPEHAGVLVAPHAVAELANAMASMSARAWDRARIIEHAGRFSWEENVTELERVLAAAVAGQPDRAGSN
jgi:glycosyltransferase involved in cell wall biosynthesis